MAVDDAGCANGRAGAVPLVRTALPTVAAAATTAPRVPFTLLILLLPSTASARVSMIIKGRRVVDEFARAAQLRAVVSLVPALRRRPSPRHRLVIVPIVHRSEWRPVDGYASVGKKRNRR